MKKERTFGIIGGIIAAIIISVIFVQFFFVSDDNDLESEIIPSNGTDYKPLPRDWITSGPFQIDRKKYALGENVFLRVSGLEFNEKGQAAFLRPLNDTHYSVYITISFDGSKTNFNQYFKPSLSIGQQICSKHDLIGTWTVAFQGTNYENLKFEIDDRVVPGEEPNYEVNVC